MRYHSLLQEKEKEIEKVKEERERIASHRKVLASEVLNLREILNKSEGEKLQFFESLVNINKALV